MRSGKSTTLGAVQYELAILHTAQVEHSVPQSSQSEITLYILWGLMMDPLLVYAVGHSIVYDNALTTPKIVAVLYVIATCGALFFSGFRGLVLLGWLNLVGLLVVMLIKSYAFTSVWCAHAAVVSVVVYFFFRRSSAKRPAKYLLAG